MLLFKAGERMLAIASTALLARLLTPADFGLVAMAMALIAGVELLAAFGFDVALIRDREAGRETYDTAWTMQVITGAGCALLLLLLTLPAVYFYREPRLMLIVPALALGTFIGGFENIGTVAFRKELQFAREFRFLMLKKLAGFAVTVPLAFAVRSYWALIAGMLASRILGVAFSYALHPYRPRWCLKDYARLMSFSKWLLVNNFIFFLYHRMPDFIIGRLSGPRTLGLYGMAFELANMPTTEIVAPVNRAIYPGYARHGGNVRELTEVYLKVAGVLWMLAPPAAVGLWLVADPLVRLLLGDQWLEAIPLVSILAVAASLGVVSGNQAYVYLAVGKPRIITNLFTAQILFIFAGALLMVPLYGAMGMAYVMVANAAIALPVNMYVFIRVTGVSTTRMLNLAWRPAVACAVMALAVLTLAPDLRGPFPSAEATWTALLSAVAIGAASYFAA
ncbi:MAG TPA: lipopolysaccharide biosynthesis protein, partial [Steroidobacteraceae bacterium]